MEAFYNKKNLFHKIVYNKELMNKDVKTLKNKLLRSPVSGVIEKIDSNNAEIIIKTYDGCLVFLYLNEEVDKKFIVSFVKEGELIFKGETVFNISCGYKNTNLVILKVKIST